jgi:uncharacterized protein
VRNKDVSGLEVVVDPDTRPRWVRRHPFGAFVAIAYALSWSLWLVAALGGGTVPFLLGALGPATSAAIVTHATGGSLRAWLTSIVRWRVPLRWWLYALLLPAALYLVVSAVLAVLGKPVDPSLFVERLPAYAGTFVLVLLVGGGMEEPGWRGFGLPELLRHHSPVRATWILGLVWGVWHVPLYGPAGFVVPAVLAFFYTALWLATRSVLLCILLHASFTPAQDHLVLLPRGQAYTDALDAPDWTILGTYVVAAILLVAVTRGRFALGGGGEDARNRHAGEVPRR